MELWINCHNVQQINYSTPLVSPHTPATAGPVAVTMTTPHTTNRIMHFLWKRMEASKMTSLKVLIIDLCISFVQSASNKQDTAQRGVVPYSVKNNVNGFYGGGLLCFWFICKALVQAQFRHQNHLQIQTGLLPSDECRRELTACVLTAPGPGCSWRRWTLFLPRSRWWIAATGSPWRSLHQRQQL